MHDDPEPQPPPSEIEEPEDTPFERFKALARRIITVPKEEADKEEQGNREMKDASHDDSDTPPEMN